MLNFEIFLAIGMFTGIVLALVLIILAARAKLVSSGDVNIVINGERTLTVPAGGKLLQTLAANNVFLSSACGGGGTCAQCKCIVESGGGDMLPTEEANFTRRQAREGRTVVGGGGRIAVENLRQPVRSVVEQAFQPAVQAA